MQDHNELRGICELWEKEILDMQIGLIAFESRKKELLAKQKASEIGVQLDAVRRNTREMKKRIEQRRSEVAGLQKAITAIGRGDRGDRGQVTGDRGQGTVSEFTPTKKAL